MLIICFLLLFTTNKIFATELHEEHLIETGLLSGIGLSIAQALQ